MTRFDDTRPAPSRQARADYLAVGRCPNGGKYSYATRGDARRANRLMAKSGPRLRPYQCPHCPDWHLTSQRQAA